MVCRRIELAPPAAAGGVFFILFDSLGFSLQLVSLVGLSISISTMLWYPFSRRNISWKHLLFCFGILLSAAIKFVLFTSDVQISAGQSWDRVNRVSLQMLEDPVVQGKDRWVADCRFISARSDGLKTSASGRLTLYGNGPFDSLGWGRILYVKGKLRMRKDDSGRVRVSMSASEWESSDWQNCFYEYRFYLVGLIEGPMAKFDTDTASYMSALLLGKRTDPGSAVIRGFRNSGCMHLLALSGFHLGLIAILVMRAFQPVMGFRVSRIVSLLIVTVYLLIAGIRPSLLRAWLMFFIWTVNSLQHRQPSSVSVLSLAFLIQITLFPRSTTGVGFRLSYAALAGLLLVSRDIAALLKRILPGKTPVLLGAGLAAQASTLPFVTASFGIWRPIGLIASPAMTPVLIVSMAYGSLLIFLDSVGLSLPDSFRAIADKMVGLLESMSKLFGSVPGIEMSQPAAWLVAGFIVTIPLIASWRLRYELFYRTEPRFPRLHPCLSRQSGTGTEETLGAELSYQSRGQKEDSRSS